VKSRYCFERIPRASCFQLFSLLAAEKISQANNPIQMPHQTPSHLNFTPTIKLFTPQGSIMTGVVEVICHNYISITTYEVQIYNVADYKVFLK
jgi:hypothetical protein